MDQYCDFPLAAPNANGFYTPTGHSQHDCSGRKFLDSFPGFHLPEEDLYIGAGVQFNDAPGPGTNTQYPYGIGALHNFQQLQMAPGGDSYIFAPNAQMFLQQGMGHIMNPLPMGVSAAAPALALAAFSPWAASEPLYRPISKLLSTHTLAGTGISFPSAQEGTCRPGTIDTPPPGVEMALNNMGARVAKSRRRRPTTITSPTSGVRLACKQQTRHSAHGSSPINMTGNIDPPGFNLGGYSSTPPSAHDNDARSMYGNMDPPGFNLGGHDKTTSTARRETPIPRDNHLPTPSVNAAGSGTTPTPAANTIGSPTRDINILGFNLSENFHDQRRSMARCGGAANHHKRLYQFEVKGTRGSLLSLMQMEGNAEFFSEEDRNFGRTWDNTMDMVCWDHPALIERVLAEGRSRQEWENMERHRERVARGVARVMTELQIAFQRAIV
ncbi:hypothetical protein BZA77DRAFT_295172 [Pyronema omphalodes]|nr:hypothetical protein BZA77DRAFT_295753 [Pyronema omphalodes]KAI5814305.1 hypothetical protein BZA77DRAFT_295172 [Pyronema omphalodes]